VGVVQRSGVIAEIINAVHASGHRWGERVASLAPCGTWVPIYETMVPFSWLRPDLGRDCRRAVRAARSLRTNVLAAAGKRA
jgi:hypothetical protein